MIFLSGPMGAGKSTVARVIGARLRCEVVDLDARLEQRLGCSIAAFFAKEGERAFRAVEREEALRIADARAVVALGGGAMTDATTRRALLARGLVVTLTGSPERLAARCGDAATRPLLRGRNAAEVLGTLLVERRAAYAECHAMIDTDRLTAEQVADEVLAVLADAPVVVPLGERTYRVEIGRGTRGRLAARANVAPGKVFVVHDGDEGRRWPREAAGLLGAASRDARLVGIPAGEEHKNLATVERIWDAALDAGADRNALVVAVGGGVVGDMAAFAASTLLRGVAFGQVPTTLLAMVDSSVGGKTGFNTRHGKNLVGTFHQPRFVLCDVDTLTTLEDAERVAGLAEVVKSAWLDGEAAVVALEKDAAALRAGEPEATIRAVRASVALKARIVAADETESGERMLLNLGHTVGHALEAAGDYRALRHGEAVALGMVAALRVGHALGTVTESDERRLVRLLEALGLPVDLDRRLDDRTFGFLGSDKKRSEGKVRFVVPGAPGATRVEPLGFDAVRRAVSR